MIKVSLEKLSEIKNYQSQALSNNIYNFKINMNKLYHYQTPKYGYCLYNFNNITSNISNGYMIVNLNDILSIKALNLLFNNDEINEISNELQSSIQLFNNINNYNNDNYQVIYYISIYNIIRRYGTTDNIIKDTIINKCNIFYELLCKYIPALNILISYQFDKFYIRQTYFNEFIHTYITTNVKYLSTNFDTNKYLIGKYNIIDVNNIHRYINNNFLSCYKNNFIFIPIKTLLNNSDATINNIINDNMLNMPYLVPLKFPTDIMNTNGEIDINTVNNISASISAYASGNTTPNRSLLNSFSSSNNIYENNSNLNIWNNNKLGYIDEKVELLNNVSRYLNNLTVNLTENNENIKSFFENTLLSCNGTIIIGANLDYIYDEIIINNIKTIILSLKKENKVKERKSIFDFIQSSTLIISTKKINIINIKNTTITQTLLETINNNIVDGAYNILVNINLTSEIFETIYKYVIGQNDGKVTYSNLYYDFELNKRLRLLLGYHTYYNKFSVNNNISSNNKYANNKIYYSKLRDFSKYVNAYTIKKSEKDVIDKCCKCCKCKDKYSINYYEVKYLPYIEDLDGLKEIDFNLFL